MKYLRYFGKFMISVGVGILLFVAWTLWGTGLYTQQQQDRLALEFDALPAFQAPISASGSDSNDEPKVGKPPKNWAPGPGDPVFKLKIPKINLNKGKGYVVVQGVDTEPLRDGPGHYPDCSNGFVKPFCTEFDQVWPGQKGRVIVSGHRTTYGAPFYDINDLNKGDKIIAETQWGTFIYEVTRQEIVAPDSRAIVVSANTAELVLTTCNPRFSAAQRLIVFAELVSEGVAK